MGSGGSKGVITLATKKFRLTTFQSDSEGRFLFNTLQYGPNHFINTANLYSPNNHDNSNTFITSSLYEWDLFCVSQPNLHSPNNFFS